MKPLKYNKKLSERKQLKLPPRPPERQLNRRLSKLE